MTAADNYLSQPKVIVLQNDAIRANHVPCILHQYESQRLGICSASMGHCLLMSL